MISAHSSELNFAEKVPDALLCTICHNLFDNPVVTPCSHVFCNRCITSKLDEAKKCPQCRKSVAANDIAIAPGYFSRLISELKVYCENRPKGCQQSVILSFLPAHQDICDYSSVHCRHNQCPYNGPTLELLRKDRAMHERECPYRPVACPNGCEAHLLENNLQSHLKICSNALVRCDLECGVSIKRHEHAKHQANHCPNFVTECCVDDCRTKVLRWRLQDHMNKHVSELHHSANENAANLRRAMTSVAQRFGKVNHSTNEMRLQHDLSDIALNEFWERRSTIQGFSTPMSPFVATVYLLSTWYLDIVSYQTGFLIVAMIVIFELKMRDTWKTLVAASTAKSIPMQIQSFREHVEKGERYTSALFIADGYQCQLEVVAVVAAKGKGTDRRLVVRLNVFSADIDDWLVWPPKFSASLSVLGANGAKSRFPLVMASGPNNWQPTPKSVPRGSFRTTLGTAQTLMKKGLVVKDTLLGVCHIASHT